MLLPVCNGCHEISRRSVHLILSGIELLTVPCHPRKDTMELEHVLRVNEDCVSEGFLLSYRLSSELCCILGIGFSR